MADAVEAGELLDIDVDHLAGMVALVAPERLGSKSFSRDSPARLSPRLTVAGETPTSNVCRPVKR